MQKMTPAFAALFLFHLSMADAYIGPGIGAGTLAVVLGILSSIFFGFIGLLWYPIKRLVRRWRSVHRGRHGTSPTENPKSESQQ